MSVSTIFYFNNIHDCVEKASSTVGHECSKSSTLELQVLQCQNILKMKISGP